MHLSHVNAPICYPTFLVCLCFSHSNCNVLERIVDSNPSQNKHFISWSCRFQFSLSRVPVGCGFVDDNYRDDQLICIDGSWPLPLVTRLRASPRGQMRCVTLVISIGWVTRPEMIYKLTVTRDTGFYFRDTWGKGDCSIFPAPRGLILSHWPSAMSQSEWRG